MEEWRSNFPFDVLEKLADFYEDAPLDSGSDGRLLGLTALDTLASGELGFPPQLVSREVEIRGLLAPITRCKNNNNSRAENSVEYSENKNCYWR